MLGNRVLWSAAGVVRRRFTLECPATRVLQARTPEPDKTCACMCLRGPGIHVQGLVPMNTHLRLLLMSKSTHWGRPMSSVCLMAVPHRWSPLQFSPHPEEGGK